MPDIFKDERDELERENWRSAMHIVGPGDDEEEEEKKDDAATE